MSEYLALCRTWLAVFSIKAPVCREVLLCDSADAAKRFATCEEVPLCNVSAAKEAMRPEVRLVLVLILSLFSVSEGEGQPHGFSPLALYACWISVQVVAAPL